LYKDVYTELNLFVITATIYIVNDLNLMHAVLIRIVFDLNLQKTSAYL